MSQLPPLTAERRRQRSALANARRLRPNDPQTADIEREYRAARLADYIRQQVNAAPRLTDDQRDELARILRPSTGADARMPDAADFMTEFVADTLGPVPGIADEREDGAA